MKFISLFSGIGGFDLGFERSGLECVAQVENNAAASSVLARHYPRVERFEDVRHVGRHNLPAADLICGGFPCQDVSLAGERAGLHGERSTLWTEFARIVCEVKPRWVVVENVVGLLSSDDGRFFGNILRDLDTCGYDAEWDVLPAAAFGAPHIRPRVFLVGYARSVVKFRGRVFQRDSATDIGGNKNAKKRQENWFELALGCPPLGGAPTYWQVIPEPSLSRMADGLPDELEQVRQYGNAIVPVVAEWIGRRIVALEEGQHG